MMGHDRVSSRSSFADFGPSLEWEGLPILGAAPRRRRQRSLRLAVAGMGLVWVGVAAIVMVLYA